MTQATIDKWEEHTPSGPLPERVSEKPVSGTKRAPKDRKKGQEDRKTSVSHTKRASESNMSGFWEGFDKRAADQTEPLEQYVSANAPGGALPGAPEKMLKWNKGGGVDPRTPEELQAAANVRMVTLPPNVEGATCSNCMHFRPLTAEIGHGFCANPDVKMDVTENMHCANWEHPDAHDPVAAAEEEAQEQEFEQAQMAQQQAQQMQQVGGNPTGEPVPGQGPAQSDNPFGQAMAGGNKTQPAGGAAQQAGEPSAEEGAAASTPVGKPSPIGSQRGAESSPLAQQALDDFQGQAAVGGPMDGGGASLGSSGSAPKKPAAKKPEKKPESKEKKNDSKDSGKSSGSSGHTININVGKEEKKASISEFWHGIVEGY